MYKQAGIKVQVFSSGKYKGMGVPGTSLTAEQKQYMQDRIDEMAEVFYQHVESCRPDAQREDMQGQVFKAAGALDRGLIDYVVADLDEAFGHLMNSVG